MYSAVAVGGVYPSMHWEGGVSAQEGFLPSPCWDTCAPPPWTEWPTLVKTLPCCSYFADGDEAAIRNCLFLFPTILAPSDKHKTRMNTYSQNHHPSHPVMNKQNKRNLESCNQSVCLHCLLTGYFFSALKYLCTKFCIWTFPLWC